MDRPGFTEKRRARLRKAVDRIERLEPRNTITEPISVMGLSVSAMRGLDQLGIVQVHGGGDALERLAAASQAAYEHGGRAAGTQNAAGNGRAAFVPISVGQQPGDSSPAQTVGWSEAKPPSSSAGNGSGEAGDWLDLSSGSSEESTEPGISTPWVPAKRAGGAAMPPRGGSRAGAQAAVNATGRAQTNHSQAGTSASIPPPIPGVYLPSPPTSNGGGGSANPAVTRNAAAEKLAQSAPLPSALASSMVPSSSGSPVAIAENPSSLPYDVSGNTSGAAMEQFQYFPLYTLDYIQGTVLFPNGYQLATLDGNVDLRAQVKGTTGVTFSWNTTNLANATNITSSGTGNFDLTFTWANSNSTAAVDSVTLTATNGSSQQEIQTYYFLVPTGHVTVNTGAADWPTSLSPDTVVADAAAWSGDNVSVDANSGALDTTLPLPSYNPNIASLVLTYDSLAADPRPIIVVPNALSGSQAVPSTVNATLTFNSVAGTTWYYNTSEFTPGDIEQIALQANATGLSTGRYPYSAQVVDEGSTYTTATYTGTATLLNLSSSAFGDGWSLQGLEQITPASGGVILSLGGGSTSLWFSGSPGVGGNYTSSAGEFSTLTKTSSGYTRTLTDGTQITFNSGGYETAAIDQNGLHTTYSYNGYDQLTSVEDPYGGLTTFTYTSGGGSLQTIEDPALRLTTLTYSGSDLTGVQQADGSRVTYTYDSGGRMTRLTDPNAYAVTISYDSAERVGTTTRPDATTEEFSSYQEQGWTNSGTSSSPAPATLLAESASSYTDPNGNLSQLRPDWYGLGTTAQTTDALGNVTTYDVNANGLATVSIDRLDRISQYAYGSLGNMTAEIYPDGNTDQYTYNSYSEPLTYTDALDNTTSYTYDSHGNNTVIQDPMNFLTTMTYTSTGQVQTMTDANDHITTYQYDSQDRLATTTFPDGTTNLNSYNSQGNVIKFTDGRGNSTTYSYDALNRTTGMTDALGNHTTYIYDADGNLLEEQDPTPAGSAARTTTYGYDSLDRVTTVTDPLGYQTLHRYDSDGNQTSITDPMGRITTTVYDALNRPAVVIDPMGNHTTTTYDAEGEILTVTDPMNRITTYTYSIRGWVATVTDPMGYITTNIYSATGQLTAADQFQEGHEFQSAGYTYNQDDQVSSYSDGLGHLTTYLYDGVGNQTAVEDANANITSYSYDSMDRLTTITNALGDTTVYGYDGSGNRQTVTDGLGHTTTTLYDADDRATTMTSALGGITTITYDAAGRETSLTDPVGNTTSWAYDADDRLTTLTAPSGHMVTYVYDQDGELTDTTDEDGRRTTYSYDADGDQTGETWAGSSPAEKITYTYDADDEMTGAADSFATLTFTYNSDGELQTDATSGPGTGQPSVTLTYSFDQLGDGTSVADSLASQGITTYSYDLAQRMTTITTSYGGTPGPQVTYTYDSANRLTGIARTDGSAAGVYSSIAYDNDNRVVTISDYSHQANTHSGYTNTPIGTYVYGYDNADRVTSEQDSEGTYTYTYDNGNELTGVSENGTPVGTYSYDLNGNRTGTGYSTTIMNETATSPGITYTYDNAGNMVSANSGGAITTYTYDYRNRLTEVTQGGTVIATYTYNALDQRIGIDDKGAQTWTVYDGSSADADPYADFNGSGTVTERYLYGAGVITGAVVDELLARTSSGGTTAWYLPDNLGSVRDIVNTAGSELDHIVYDSFGNVVTETNAANGDRFKFAGMEYDSATGQYYDHARNYDSVLGTFTGQDPMGFSAGDMDLYGYVENGPTDATDPTGLMGGDPQYEAAYAAFYAANPGYYQWCGPLLASLTLDDVLNTSDGFAAGMAHAVTGGLSTRIRSGVYGGIATQNHSGAAFNSGQMVGTGIGIGLGFGNPCAMGRSIGAAYRGLSAMQGLGDLANGCSSYNNGDYLGGG